jgi:hypothetical protein
MPEIINGRHVTSYVGLCIFLVLWIVLLSAVRLLIMLIRREPLIGWAIGPFGVTVMVLHEPSVLHTWLNVLCPALVSGGVLYVGLFTPLSPIDLPEHPLFRVLVIGFGVLISSTVDLINALRDLCYPLWGEARVLRSIQFLRATWAKIHFTPFGYSYLSDHFNTTPTDLLRVIS